MGSMNDHTEIRDAMNRAACVLAGHPPEKWAQWAVHLLQELDEKARVNGQGDVYAGVLDSIRRDIISRINVGRW